MSIKHHQSSQVGIIADDLTSAADGAGPFVARGLHTMVSRKVQPQLGKAPDVISIDCASRSMNATSAAHVVGEIVATLKNSKILYKTVNSTLRGNVKQEIYAAYRASGRKRLIIAPAFPEAGRTTQNGIQLLDGIPVSQTQYANDPIHPALTSNIAELIDTSIGSFLILDAQTQAELDQQIAAIANPENILWVGSPGMAQSLAKIIAPKTKPINSTQLANKILVVVGSANAISQKQASLLGDVDHVHCLMSPSERQNNPKQILNKLCQQAIDKIQNEGFDALIATGGDTMEALLDELNIQQFQLVDELEAGFSMGIAEMTSGRPLAIAMKAGGFGTPETLLAATQKLLGH